MPVRLFAAILAAACPLAAAGPIDIAWKQGGYCVQNWQTPTSPPPGGWERLLFVSLGSAEASPLLGKHRVENGELCFRPRFPVEPGLTVYARFVPPGGEPVKREFNTAPRPIQVRTRVEAVFPSVDVLPSNLLKFYVHFSAPMQRGEAWTNLQLLDAAGRAVELPFLEIDQELWDPEQCRLTVLFDPGRIKRGVLPREEGGPALEAGQRYTLVVSGAWRDANGFPLEREFRKTFRTGGEDRAAIDPARWRIEPPRAGTRQALTVDFGEPLDRALALRLIEVEGHEGSVRLLAGDARWEFVPSAPWAAGAYRLRIDSRLEDLAGNRVGRAFDVDVFERVTKRVTAEFTRLTFLVAAQ